MVNTKKSKDLIALGDDVPFLSSLINNTPTWAAGLGGLVGLGLGGVIVANSVYKKCPPNKLLVVYGRGIRNGSRIIQNGGSTVFPYLQSYNYMSLEPMAMEIPLKGALSLEKIRVDVPCVYTVAVSSELTTAENAARRLLGMGREEIEHQAKEVIVGQMRQVLAGLTIDEINRDRDKFVSRVQEHCCNELEKLGLELLNTNVQNITDDSGVIEELGKKAAAEVKQQATIDVATQEKMGAIGVSHQDKDKDILVWSNRKERDIGVREAERETRTRIEELEAEELQAVNLARKKKAESDAALAVANAGYKQQSQIAEKEAEAAIAEAVANAKARAALAHAGQVEAESRAEKEAEAKVQKDKMILDAEAKAEEITILAEAEAKRRFAVAQAEARGNAMGMKEKAEALKAVVDACGGSEEAYRLLLLEHIDKLAETSATAISNIKFDKVVVWDSGGGESGSSGVQKFIKDITSSVPPAMNVIEDIVGIPVTPGLDRDKKIAPSAPITAEEAKAFVSDQE